MIIHSDIGVSDNCINIYTYGEICVWCGCCEREPNEKKRISNQLKYYEELLKEAKAFSYWDDNEKIREIQKKNVKKNIDYYEQKIKELKEQSNVGNSKA